MEERKRWGRTGRKVEEDVRNWRLEGRREKRRLSSEREEGRKEVKHKEIMTEKRGKEHKIRKEGGETKVMEGEKRGRKETRKVGNMKTKTGDGGKDKGMQEEDEETE